MGSELGRRMFVTIGNGGHKFEESPDGPVPVPVGHEIGLGWNSCHFTELHHEMPFVIRPPAPALDLSPKEAKRFLMKRLITVGRSNWYAYYGMYAPIINGIVQMYLSPTDLKRYIQACCIITGATKVGSAIISEIGVGQVQANQLRDEVVPIGAAANVMLVPEYIKGGYRCELDVLRLFPECDEY